MNELPPLIIATPSGARTSATTSKASSQKHLLLALAGGLVAGLLLATLFWVSAGLLYFSRARSQPGEVRESIGSTDVSDNATLAEIDAAAQLNFEQNRVALFNQIAARPNLTADAQLHLVEAIFKNLNFENNQLEVLLKLVANPSFSPSAKEKILKNLNRLNLENHKQSLLDAMNRRESQK